jgi:hypothetical protein
MGAYTGGPDVVKSLARVFKITWKQMDSGHAPLEGDAASNADFTTETLRSQRKSK